MFYVILDHMGSWVYWLIGFSRVGGVYRYDLGSNGSQGVCVHINNDSSECDIIDVLCHIGLLGSWIHWLIGGSKGWWGSYVLCGKHWFSGGWCLHKQ